MNEDLGVLFQKEKRLSFFLLWVYVIAICAFLGAFVALFMLPETHRYFVLAFIGVTICILATVYSIIARLLFNHRAIAAKYQQVFNFESLPLFGDCAKRLQEQGFVVFADEKLIVANKLLLQNHKGFIRRDYLVQILVTAEEIELDSYVEERHEAIGEYFKNFEELRSRTKNKIISIGTHIHFVKTMPENLDKEFKTQAGQRYLFRFDVVAEESTHTLYYPKHIESYQHRTWHGKPDYAPYGAISDVVRSIFFERA